MPVLFDGGVRRGTGVFKALALGATAVGIGRAAEGHHREIAHRQPSLITVRTQQRRLASAGLSYQELLDGVRRDSAERYIASTALSIDEIAYLLGYSEPAAFHRAFKRWHDVTPQAFREQRRRVV